MLPTDPKERKNVPIATGVLDYFPDALAYVALVSKRGGEQHHPGQPLHWDRSKSTDESDALLRHFLERGTIDSDGLRHSGKVAWRALALLQKEIEATKKPKPDAIQIHECLAGIVCLDKDRYCYLGHIYKRPKMGLEIPDQLGPCNGECNNVTK